MIFLWHLAGLYLLTFYENIFVLPLSASMHLRFHKFEMMKRHGRGGWATYRKGDLIFRWAWFSPLFSHSFHFLCVLFGANRHLTCWKICGVTFNKIFVNFFIFFFIFVLLLYAEFAMRCDYIYIYLFSVLFSSLLYVNIPYRNEWTTGVSFSHCECVGEEEMKNAFQATWVRWRWLAIEWMRLRMR